MDGLLFGFKTVALPKWSEEKNIISLHFDQCDMIKPSSNEGFSPAFRARQNQLNNEMRRLL
ncbi:hypothetical protein Q9L42_004505 [Methylomarinum sp. Ch1-1]|uniref:Uncharacterized protein n=1 Tax=Methylomarinum roseum TaxID=3067653 RepID=A0AAU7NWJ5_9GAMM|nr:hypothetical protein [Methylomarinum sp. Ch1-1]MDP4522545.1 hypothetical protein [Methylomarinum sp. Ch1-1]